jgi:hypothetical protein
MEELTAKLAKPLDRDNLNNDVGVLNSLLGMLNNPAITGAEVPKGEPAKVAPVDRAGASIPPANPGLPMSESVQAPKAQQPITPVHRATVLLKQEEALVETMLRFCAENKISPTPTPSYAIRAYLTNVGLKKAFDRLEEKITPQEKTFV